jgi:hypothetical protein
MKTYIMVSFVTICWGTLINMAQMLGNHPRKRADVSVGEDTVGLILRIACLTWAAWLLFGH